MLWRFLCVYNDFSCGNIFRVRFLNIYFWKSAINMPECRNKCNADNIGAEEHKNRFLLILYQTKMFEMQNISSNGLSTLSELDQNMSKWAIALILELQTCFQQKQRDKKNILFEHLKSWKSLIESLQNVDKWPVFNPFILKNIFRLNISDDGRPKHRMTMAVVSCHPTSKQY